MAEKRTARTLLIALISLMVTGCLVSKEVYQTEFVRASELEAKNEDLANKISEKAAALENMKTRAETLEKERAALEAELIIKKAAALDAEKRAENQTLERQNVMAELDVAKKALRSSETESALLKEKLKAADAVAKENIKETKEKLAARDAEIEQLRTRIQNLESERDVLIEARHKAENLKKEEVVEVSKTYEGLIENMKSEIEKGQIEISNLKGKLSVKMNDEILFSSGSAEIVPEGREVLKKIGQSLKEAADKMIIIEGHTDNIPIKGPLAETYPTNWELSTARAVSVVRYLSEKAGMDATRLEAAGLGEHHPVEDNSTKEGRAKNRRIEIRITPLEAE